MFGSALHQQFFVLLITKPMCYPLAANHKLCLKCSRDSDCCEGKRGAIQKEALRSDLGSDLSDLRFKCSLERLYSRWRSLATGWQSRPTHRKHYHRQQHLRRLSLQNGKFPHPARLSMTVNSNRITQLKSSRSSQISAAL